MKHVMIWLIGLYRKYISPLKPPCCRFTPTCSAYAIEAFKKRGFFIGFILSTWRFLRCNPFSKGGYDPVPEKGLRPPKGARPPIVAPIDDPEARADGTDGGDGTEATATKIANTDTPLNENENT